MSNELQSTNNLIEFDSKELSIIKNQFFSGNPSDKEVEYCLGVARSLGLNPITKEIWFVERSSKVNGQWVKKIDPMCGRDSYIKIAHRSGMFGGIETTCSIKQVPVFGKDNTWGLENDLVATCKVYKKDIERPFIVEVNYSEYVQRTSQGIITKFWKEKANTMIKKVAESQALRKAFNITGLYDEAEMPLVDNNIDKNINTQQQLPNNSTRNAYLSNINQEDKQVQAEVIKEPTKSLKKELNSMILLDQMNQHLQMYCIILINILIHGKRL